MSEKRIRRNIFDLKNNYPDEFAKFILALDSFEKSEDWTRICGIHGLTFTDGDKNILCPVDPKVVSKITGIGEPQYCTHGVAQFSIWHHIYLLEFEFLLNKHSPFQDGNFISLPWLDFPNIKNQNASFLSDPNITIKLNSKNITIPNPLANGNIYLNGKITKTKRSGFINPRTRSQKNLMTSVDKDLLNTLSIGNYESFSSTDIPKKRITITNTVPIESPHNQIHVSIGGRNGSMSSVTTAAHDPIFWLHHCNIDRYFYNWVAYKTNNFTKKLTSNEILPETLNLFIVPFFPSQTNLLFSDNYLSYKFCWENNTSKYLSIGEVFDLSNFQYTYEKIFLKENLLWIHEFCELISIPILPESVEINLYIVPNKIIFENLDLENKENFLAGTSCWFGINRDEIYCSRCEKTRTNISINISNYLIENNINKKNINNYNLILEGIGLNKIDSYGNNKIYSHDEILSGSKMILCLDENDIISNKEFKFEKKYSHTKLVKSVLNKLSKYGYYIDNSLDSDLLWESVEKIKNNIDLIWRLPFEKFIKLKNIDKISNTNDIIGNQNLDTEQKINLIKEKIMSYVENINKSENIDNIEIKYKLIGFNENLVMLINKCIEEWVDLINIELLRLINNTGKSIGAQIKFIEVLESDSDNFDLKLEFVSIDGEYQVCGSTYQSDNKIFIDIDSEENYNISGLFDLVVKHELGHAFGLTHSYNHDSIMFPFIDTFNKKVSPNDIINIFSR